MIELSELEQLVEMVQRSNIRDLTLRQGEARLVLRKQGPEEVKTQSTALVVQNREATSYYEEEGAISEAVFASTEPEEASTLPITAPMVGIFHHVKPMVGLGARVTEGQVIGVIEAMRLVNEVTAPSDGVISDLVIEDGQPVEYGQTLYILDPQAG